MPTLFATQLVGGRFRLLREIGRGAAGAVWHVRNETTEHDFALKVLLAESAHDPVVLRRFLNEARAAGRVRHPNVVEVYDTGTLEDGTPYQVMQLLEGESLGARLKRMEGGRMTLAMALRVTRDVARGLAAAHARGIVHRDVKPENVFLTAPDDAPVAKLLDFGVSKLEDAAGDPLATRQGALLGSPAYMSPEQIESSADVDARADVWAVGILLYRCLTGRVPFPQRGLRELAFAITTAPPPSLTIEHPGVPSAVIAIVERCLAKSPDERFESAAALADALEGAMTSSALMGPASAARASVVRRRRRRVSAAMVTGAILAVAVAGAALAARHSPAQALETSRATADPSSISSALVSPPGPARADAPLGDVVVVEAAPSPSPRGAVVPHAGAASVHRAPARRPSHEGVVEPGF
jgi:serine/threonine protein kinase